MNDDRTRVEAGLLPFPDQLIVGLCSPDLPISGSANSMAADLENHLARKKLLEYDPEAIEDVRAFRDEVTLYIRPTYLLRACEFLRDEVNLRFRFLADVTALDLYPQEPRFEVVYHLLSLETGERLRLKVRVEGGNPRIPSVVPVWPSANAFEREVFDLFGIVFEGHPLSAQDSDARRLGRPSVAQGLSDRGLSLDVGHAGANSGAGRTGHPQHGPAASLHPRGVAFSAGARW